MELIHTLTYNGTTTTIDEPIGFDDLKTTLKRHDYHGIGAEVSLGTLEFYGIAYAVVSEGYASSIDADVAYEVRSGATVIFSGKVDLSTCSFKEGDYKSVTAKVGEIGAKTTFNNRTDTEIDLNEPKTVDGSSVTNPDWLNLHIPVKHLLYTNKSTRKADAIVTTEGGDLHIGNGYYVFLPIGLVETNEFGNFEESNPYSSSSAASVGPQYIASEDHEDKYGHNTTMDVEVVLSIVLEKHNAPISQDADYSYCNLTISDEDGHSVSVQKKFDSDYMTGAAGQQLSLDFKASGTFSAGGSLKYHLQFTTPQGSLSWTGSIKVKKGSYVKMLMYDNLEETDPVNADMLLVHDALDVVTHSISENALSVKSDWYRTPESLHNAGTTGGGALKALTNGYKIRGLFTDENDNPRNMPVSFKTLIESLDAQDCIGWGFSEEDGTTYVRVERWDWFYKNNTVLTLTNVAEVNTDVNTDSIPTEFKIGYKKYATSDEYNSIESPHGTRTFNNGIKALTKALTKECEFVADNYAIEETRRAKKAKSETEETTYDESIFLFELIRKTLVGQQYPVYSIGNTSISPQNVGRWSEFINAKLTPRHMAARWRGILFTANNDTPFRFTSGEINYKSSFSCYPESQTTAGVTTQSLRSFAETSPQTENDDITFLQSILKAEKISFSCPISVDQYKAIKAAPYGLVSVNGRLGWIHEFRYSFYDGMAEFTLIAKR